MSSPKRDWFVAAGMFVSAASAAVSSFSGLRSLALVAGWSATLAPLLPLTIDAYAMSATRVWLADTTASARARRFARKNAVGAILASLLGNATYHAIAAGLVSTSWAVVVVVGAVPPVVLGLVSHLAVLRRQVDPPNPAALRRPKRPARPLPPPVPSPALVPAAPKLALDNTSPRHSSRPQDAPAKPPSPRRYAKRAQPNRPRYGTEDVLLAAARAADAEYRAAHDGKPISRDELRRALRIGSGRATAVLRRLRTDSPETVQTQEEAHD